MKFNEKHEAIPPTASIPVDSFPFDAEDDRYLWRAVIDYVLSTWEPKPGSLLEIGRCSHWLSPHNTRWTAGGGFAWPVGYGNGIASYSYFGLPQLDWSYLLTWTDHGWEIGEIRELDGSCPDLRIAIPSRTYRHEQAAIHTRWRIEREFRTIFFGFRHKLHEGWSCTADSSIRRAKKRNRGRKPRTHRQKAKLRRYTTEDANDCTFF